MESFCTVQFFNNGILAMTRSVFKENTNTANVPLYSEGGWNSFLVEAEQSFNP